MSEKLKPCPFCGSRAVVCCTADYGYIVRCDGDDCQCCCPTTWYCNTEEQAIETWNRRAGDNESERKQDVPDMNDGKMIYEQAAIEAVMKETYADGAYGYADAKALVDAISALPPVQPKHDIPMKPRETTDRAWGIPKKQAVCPNCDHYLGNWAFLGEGKKIVYCENCGQAIDFEGWDFDG